MESNEVPCNPMASCEVAVSVTLQTTDKQEEVPTDKPTMRGRHTCTHTHTHTQTYTHHTHTYIHTHLLVLL